MSAGFNAADRAKRAIRRALRPTLLAAAFLVVAAAPATASSFAVTNINDSGPGSLRQAIIDADASTDASNTIAVSATGEIKLLSVLPAITQPMQIQGPGAASLDVNGQNANAIFVILGAGGVGISGLTVSNGSGSSGGAIRNEGMLTITNSTVSGSTATQGGGIYNTGVLTLTNVTVTGNMASYVGGIDNQVGTVFVVDSTVSGNTSVSSDGGGIRNIGTATITDSTISGNTAGTFGGGLDNVGGSMKVARSTVSGNTAGDRAGGIINLGHARMTIDSSTITGNTSNGGGGGGGGGIQNDGTGDGSSPPAVLTIVNSTIANNSTPNNGGGVDTFDLDSSPSITPTTTIMSSTVAGNNAGGAGGGLNEYQGSYAIQNSVIADNTAGTTNPDCSNAQPNSPPFGSEGYNLIGDTTGCTGFTGIGDLVAVNPLLGFLAQNGGPTETFGLLPGSPALGAGDPLAPGSGGSACPVSDQRGLPRGGAAGRCDIGAVQPGPPAIAIVAPSNGAAFTQGQTANASYSCTADPTTTIASCSGPVASGSPISTSTLGSHPFTVTATDALGVTSTQTTSYTVAPASSGMTPGGGTSPARPVISRASFQRSSFSAARGTTLRLTLSQAATVQVTITQTAHGHKVHGRCKPRATAGKPCTTTTQDGRLTFSGRSGSNAFAFRPRALKPGRYSTTLIATNSAGDKSIPVILKFTLEAKNQHKRRK